MISAKPTFIFLVVFSLSTVWPNGAAADDRGEGRRGGVRQRFSVPRDGEGIILPVRIDDQDYSFLLDTGYTKSSYDTRLLDRVPLSHVTRRTPIGAVRTALYSSPGGWLGNIRIPSGIPVVGENFETIRQAFGRPIYGIIGMDMLKDYIIKLDFDSGEVLFLDSLGTPDGTSFRLSYHLRRPQLVADVGGVKEQKFLIDTGRIGFESGGLSTNLFDRLLREERLEIIGTTVLMTGSGQARLRVGRAGVLTIGPHSLRETIFVNEAANSLGLQFLSRYVVTFDFPNDRLYLKKGKGFDRPDGKDLGGMGFSRIDGKTVVVGVEEGSVAALAGIRKGDVILKVDGEGAERYTLFELRRLLTVAGSKLKFAIERDNSRFDAVVELAGEKVSGTD